MVRVTVRVRCPASVRVRFGVKVRIRISVKADIRGTVKDKVMVRVRMLGLGHGDLGSGLIWGQHS